MIKPACTGFFVGDAFVRFELRLSIFWITPIYFWITPIYYWGLFLYEQKVYLRIIFNVEIILSLLIWFQLLVFESFFISRVIFLHHNRLKMAIFIL